MFNLRFALRTLFKAPLVTTVAILSLALGIGANVAIFSLIDQVILRPLPVPRPGDLVNLGAPGPKPGSTNCNQSGDCETVLSYPMFRDLEKEQTAFGTLAAFRIFPANLTLRDHTISGDAQYVSGSYFAALELKPALGRLVGPDDDRAPGASPVAVLSHALWQSEFGSSPDVLGQQMTINGRSLTAIGVAPKGFHGTTFGSLALAFIPLTMRDVIQGATPAQSFFASRRIYWLYVFGRLKPGVSIDQARASLNVPYHAIVNDVEAALQTSLSQSGLVRFRARTLAVEPGAHGMSSAATNARSPLALLFGVAVFVLVIASANIANLLLARSAARSSEIAIRLAIGASRGRLIAQLLLESCLLAAFGGAAGLVVARVTLVGIASILPPRAAQAISLSLDPRALAFAAAVTMATGILFGLFPALHSTRTDLVSAIKNQAGQPSGGRSASRFRTVIATAQIAMSMALLVSAGLFVRSLVNISRVALGLNIDHVITFSVSPGLSGYAVPQTLQYYARLEEELSAIPGITAVTEAQVPLLADSNSGNEVLVEGFPVTPDTDTNVRYNGVGVGYFDMFDVPFLAGRDFTQADTGSPKVVIVNESFARKFNMGHDVVGRHIGYRDTALVSALGGNPVAPLDMEIVGLVRDAKYSSVKNAIPPQFFRPNRELGGTRSMTIYVRGAGEADALASQIRHAVDRIDPNVPADGLRTMDEQVRQNIFLDRLVTILSTAFAVLATLLAAVGLYGVLAYTVTLRKREIGLRMALGADAGRVRAMVLRQVAKMTVAGGLIGLRAALGIGRVAESLLYHLKGSDPLVLAGAAISLSLVALLAGLLPAHRASRVDPMRVLRYE